jgi:hypothetical protein
MARILERTLNPRVAPGRILLGHSSDELPDLDDNTAAAGPRCPIRSFARDQLPVPPQQCVWRDDRRDLTYHLSAQPVCTYRQPSPIVVNQPRPASPCCLRRTRFSSIRYASASRSRRSNRPTTPRSRKRGRLTGRSRAGAYITDCVSASASRRSSRGTVCDYLPVEGVAWRNTMCDGSCSSLITRYLRDEAAATASACGASVFSGPSA